MRQGRHRGRAQAAQGAQDAGEQGVAEAEGGDGPEHAVPLRAAPHDDGLQPQRRGGQRQRELQGAALGQQVGRRVGHKGRQPEEEANRIERQQACHSLAVELSPGRGAAQRLATALGAVVAQPEGEPADQEEQRDSRVVLQPKHGVPATVHERRGCGHQCTGRRRRLRVWPDLEVDICTWGEVQEEVAHHNPHTRQPSDAMQRHQVERGDSLSPPGR